MSSLTPSPASASPDRMDSIDALRGFAMFWIIGADSFSGAFLGMGDSAFWQGLGRQLSHPEWIGFSLYDLIFPLFVFVVGLSVAVALPKQTERLGRAGATGKVLKRAALLFVLGILYYGGMSEGLDRVRLLGVLQRLALCYLAVSLVCLYLKPRYWAPLAGAILVGYWALLKFVPFPGGSPGLYVEGKNIVNWFDSMYLPLRRWNGTHDPEGILSTLPAVGTCLLGLIAGRTLVAQRDEPFKVARDFAFAGIIFLGLGYLWSWDVPLIKKLWTSSYVLVAGGWSLLLLAGFHLLMAGLLWKRWATVFIWVGSNALMIYLLCRCVEFGDLALFFIGGQISSGLDSLHEGLARLTQAFLSVGLSVAVCAFFYRRKVFLRL